MCRAKPEAIYEETEVNSPLYEETKQACAYEEHVPNPYEIVCVH